MSQRKRGRVRGETVQEGQRSGRKKGGGKGGGGGNEAASMRGRTQALESERVTESWECDKACTSKAKGQERRERIT